MRSTFLTVASMVLILSGAGNLSASDTNKLDIPQPGSVDAKTGLEAWSRIFQVTSHPRCSNCHVGESEIPMWSGPSYGKSRPHGMGIRSGESRIGAEFLDCSSCHVSSSIPQATAHSAPRTPGNWQLAPVSAGWFGKSSAEICAQLRDPKRNGDMDYIKLAQHVGHDAVLKWAWSPGPGREPAPFTHEKHVMDMYIWGAAGQPCPQG